MLNGRTQCDSIEGCGKFYDGHLIQCPSCNLPEFFSDFIPFNPLDWIYDLETYPNIFTASFKHVNTGTRLLFEISDRRNDLHNLYIFLTTLEQAGCRLIGYNNVGFDYPIIHFIIEHFALQPTFTDLYNKSQQIFNTSWGNRFDHVIWDNDTHIQQIDLYKIHHFDNENRRTSLKMLEFNMRMPSVEDLPFPPGTVLNDLQKNTLIKYNDHDVDATELFYIQSIELIEFREQLSSKYDRNFLNHNDTKLGKDYFIMELEKALPGSCYTRCTGRRLPRQTIRPYVSIADVILPYIKFKVPEFERIKQWLSSQVITETKGVFENLNCVVNGFKYVFGAGGIHGSIDPAIIESDSDYIIYDWDVASYYPNLAIVNNLYPEHLSEQFCKIYKDVFEQRRQYKKGTPENAMLKLALNGVYGDSNNRYSPFYDSQYMMSITINGQLLLCMLAQYLIDIPGLKMIQINTDGLTIRCPRQYVDDMKKICKWWENYTCLELESATYSRMFIRDVNNYIAEYEDGKLKRKGAYGYETPMQNPTTQERQWHKNHSSLVIPKAAEAALVHGQDIADFIHNHDNIYDFMLRAKVGRQDQLMFNDIFGKEIELQKITRYYISTKIDAGSLTKISPPAKGHKVGSWKRATKLTDQFYNSVIAELNGQDHSQRLPHDIDTDGLPWDERINTKNRSKYKTRTENIDVGYLAMPCNDVSQAEWVQSNYHPSDLDYNYYITETEKLVKSLQESGYT